MTNEEAIKVIKSNYPSSHYTMLREACNVAINSLAKIDKYEALINHLIKYEVLTDGLCDLVNDDYYDWCSCNCQYATPQRCCYEKFMEVLSKEVNE